MQTAIAPAAGIPTIAATVGMPLQTVISTGGMQMQPTVPAASTQPVAGFSSYPPMAPAATNPTLASADNPPIGQPIGYYYSNGTVQLFNEGQTGNAVTIMTMLAIFFPPTAIVNFMLLLSILL